VHLYRDMTARDLLIRRSTNRAGDTVWEPAPLVRAALLGEVRRRPRAPPARCRLRCSCVRPTQAR